MIDSYDVVCVGGAVIGSAVAYFLSENPEFDGTIAVIEPDPAVGRGLSELITYGEYRTLDLTPLGYERIANNQPFYENVVI